MEAKEYVAAVDLGTTKIVVAVACRAEKNKVEIVALKEMPSRGVIRGDVKNSEQAAAVIREVCDKLETELGFVINDVYIGISGQHIRCTKATGYVFVQSPEGEVSEVSEVDVRRLRDDMRNSSVPIGQSIIAVLPQSYTLDEEGNITEPVGMEGKRLEARFNLIVGEDAAIDRIRRTFSRVGLHVAGIILQPLASSEAVLSDDEKELGVAVVDIGGGTTDVCIYYDKIIRHIAVIPIGGNVVNGDIKAYGILERHVERLKTAFGEAVPEKAPAEKYVSISSVSGQAAKEISVKTLAMIIEARMEEIVALVVEEIEKCGLKNRLGAGIVLTGGGALLKNIDLLFRQKSKYDCRIAMPSMYLTPESAEKVASPKYSTITGLLVDAVHTGKYTQVEVRPVAVEAAPEPAPAPAPAPIIPQRAKEHFTPLHTQAPVPLAAPDNYDEEEYEEEGNLPEETITEGTRRRPGFFKRMISGLFEEKDDLEDDENY